MKHLAPLSFSLAPRCPVQSRLPHATDLRHIILNCIGIPLAPTRAKGHPCTSNGLLCAGQNIYIHQRQTDWTVPYTPFTQVLRIFLEQCYRCSNRFGDEMC